VEKEEEEDVGGLTVGTKRRPYGRVGPMMRKHGSGKGSSSM
jgi:hypothetical protein